MSFCPRIQSKHCLVNIYSSVRQKARVTLKQQHSAGKQNRTQSVKIMEKKTKRKRQRKCQVNTCESTQSKTVSLKIQDSSDKAEDKHRD